MTEQTAGTNDDGLERALGPGAREAVNEDPTKSAPAEVDEELQLQTLTVDEERKTEFDALVTAGEGTQQQAPSPTQQTSRSTVTNQSSPATPPATPEENPNG